jgi:hypothetical protein
MIRICRENGIEISGHHPGGLPGLPAGNWNLTHNSFYPGFMHEHFGKLVDYKLQDGMQLKGFDALKDIVEHAGGHAEGARHIIVSATDKAAGGLADAGAHLQNQDLNLRRIYELVAGAGVLAGGGYLAKKFWKQRETKRAADIEQRPRVGRRDNDAAAAAGGTGEKAKKEILRTAQAEKNLSAGGLLGAGLDIAQERPEELPQDDGDDDEPGQVKLVAKNLPTATEKNQKGDLPAKNRGADFKTDGGKIAQPEKPTQELKEHKDQTLDPDYGIEKWKVPYYKKAVDLKILGVDEPVHISRLTEKREIALTQFILLMNEGSDSAFHVLYQDREAEMQKGLKEALVSLKGGRAENLRIFCSRIFEDGENFKNVSEAARILGCIRDLSPQAGGIVKQALREFNLKRRKEKK